MTIKIMTIMRIVITNDDMYYELIMILIIRLSMITLIMIVIKIRIKKRLNIRKILKTLKFRPNDKNSENVNIQKGRDIRKMRPHFQNNDNDDNNDNNNDNNDENQNLLKPCIIIEEHIKSYESHVKSN